MEAILQTIKQAGFEVEVLDDSSDVVTLAVTKDGGYSRFQVSKSITQESINEMMHWMELSFAMKTASAK